MDRRGFLGLILAAGAAPAIVRAGSLMRVRPVLGAAGAIGWTPEITLAEAEQMLRYDLADILYNIRPTETMLLSRAVWNTAAGS